MKRIVILMPVLILFFSCAFMESIVGSGDLVEMNLGYTGFNALEISAPFDVTLIHDDAYSITIMVDDNVIDKVESYKDGKTLAIGLNDSYRYTEVSLRAVITMPALNSVELSNAAQVTVIDSASFPGVSTFRGSLRNASHLLLPSIVADTVMVNLSGASRANIGAYACDASITIKDASSLQMNGSTSDLNLTVDNASVATLKEFSAGGATVSLDDASEAWIYVNGVLNFNLAGASSLYYRGAVNMGSTFTVIESSSINTY